MATWGKAVRRLHPILPILGLITIPLYILIHILLFALLPAVFWVAIIAAAIFTIRWLLARTRPPQ